MGTLIATAILTIVFTIAHWWDAFHLVSGVPVATGVLFLMWKWQKSRASANDNTEPDLFSYKPPAEVVSNNAPSESTKDPWPRRILFGIIKGGVTLLAVWLVFLVANATPLPSLFYDRGFDKLISNDIPLLQSAKAYGRITEISQQRLEGSLSIKKQTALAQYVYQAMIDWGNGLTDSTARIQKFSEARDFAKKWNLDSQLAEAKLEGEKSKEKLKEIVTGPSDLLVGTSGAITQVDTSSFPPVIIAYVAVEGTDGEPIDWLKSKDFLVSNNDAPITKFEVAPISSQDQSAIVMAMDVSGSTAGQPLASSQAGAQTFVGMLGNNDLIELIQFNQDVKVLASWEKDKKELTQKISKLHAHGKTAIYDAINKGVDDLLGAEQSQKAIVLFTDGSDTDSQCSMKSALDRANMAQIPIYVIGLKSEDLSSATLDKIALKTSGRYFEAASPDELQIIYQKVGNKIKKQYRVVMTVAGDNLPMQNLLTISIGRKNSINLAKSYER